MRVQWYRVKKIYEKPHDGFLAIGPRYPGVLSDHDRGPPFYFRRLDRGLIPLTSIRGTSPSCGPRPRRAATPLTPAGRSCYCGRLIQNSRVVAAVPSLTRPPEASAFNAATDACRSAAVGVIAARLPPLASRIKRSTASTAEASLAPRWENAFWCVGPKDPADVRQFREAFRVPAPKCV